MLRNKLLVSITLCATIVVAYAMLLLGSSVRYLVDDFRNGGATIVYMMFRITIILSIGSFARTLAVNTISDRVVITIFSDLYQSIISRSPTFFHHFKKSDIINRVSKDCNTIKHFIASTASYSLRNIIMLIGSVIMMIIISTKVTLVLSLMIPAIIIILTIGMKSIKSISKDYNKLRDSIITVFESTIEALKTIQSFGGERYESQKIDKVCKNLHKKSTFYNLRKAILVACIIVSVIVIVSLTIYTGINAVKNHEITEGYFVSFIVYTLIATTSLFGLSEMHNEIHSLINSSRRVFEIISSDIGVVKSGIITQVKFDINFQNVSFTYPDKNESMVLKGFTCHIPHGSKTAIIGSSGSGKSTIIDLILRFYDSNSGRIVVDDIDIRDLDLQFWRSKVSTTLQEYDILSGTVMENIQYMEKDNTLPQEFVKTLGLKKISNTDYGFLAHSTIGDNGSQISAGERQRIAFARCLSKQSAEIFIFDEVTSFLDKKNRNVVMESIIKYTSNKTVIFITHHPEEFSHFFDQVIDLSNYTS